MIEGQFKPFQRLQFEPLEQIVVDGIELTFVGSANSTAQTITWPGGLTSECVAFLFDHAVNTIGIPSEVIPTGFDPTPITSTTLTSSRYTVSFKYPLTGSESGSLTGQNGNSSNKKVLLIFKIAGGSQINFGGIKAEITDNNPTAQTTAASGSNFPSLVLGVTSNSNAAVTFTTESPNFDNIVSTSNTHLSVGHKIYNASPSDHTIDMNDVGNRNILNCFTVQFGTAGYSNATYDATVAAITNKTLYCRADTSYALGDTLTTKEWNNEVVSTPNISGTSTIEANIQNGFRGMLSNAGVEFGSSGTAFKSDFLGNSSLSYTVWAVEKRTGTQGSNTGNNRYQNSGVVGDSTGYVGMGFDTSSRRFLLHSYNGTYLHTDTGFDFSDGVPYVLAWRVASDGAVRVNFNGNVFTAAAGSQVESSGSGLLRLNKWTAGTNYGFEYIISSNAASDTDMDNLVNALKTKWAIS
jgi:hypothetical protein